MVGIFASLKWRLVTSRIRTVRGGAKAGLILAWCAAAIVLAAVVLALVVMRTSPEIARTTVTTLFTAQFVAWALAPMVAFGVDETVDPAKFALLPMTNSTLRKGLLVTALIGYLPVANAVVLVGAAIALSSTWSVLPLALLACVVQLFLCVVVSRTLSAALSNLMSGRRGRDLGVMVGFGVFVVYFGLNYSLNSESGANRFGRGATALASVLGWAPPGALAQFPGWIAAGRLGRAAVALLIGLAALALLWWWWGRTLTRSLTSGPSNTENAAPRRAAAGVAVADSVVGTMKVVASRDRVLVWRDPTRRVAFLMIAFLAVVYPFLLFHGHGSLYAVALPSLLASSMAANCYGTDGSGVWLHMVTFADHVRARGEILGHSLVAIVPATGIVVAALAVQATLRHDWHLFPGALGICWAVMLGGAAMAGWLSARLPYAARQSRKSMFANAISGQKGRTGGATLATMGGGLAIASPAIGLAALGALVNPVYGWAAMVVGPLVGVIAVLVLSRRGADLYVERMPEILAVVAIGDRA